jgi:glycosyltransferase involved in cell wall biosynthesis
MREEIENRGGSLHVHFLSRAHHDRPHWRSPSDAASFPHTYWRDLGPAVRGKAWHFNPGLILHLVLHPPHYLMLGGPWDSATGTLLSLAARRSTSVAWFEGNTRTPGRIAGAALRLKKTLLSGFTYMAVPGQEGSKFARLILGERSESPILILPNVVDESKFGSNSASRQAVREELGIRPSQKLALWPARLIPAKGVIPFLAAVDEQDLDGWTLALLGDGPLRGEIERLIKQRGLRSVVRVLPSVSYDRMPGFYAAADLFLLPSLHDPNPLSVVEALHSGLPLLVSNRIGNLPEALEQARNGWSLEPSSVASVRATAHEAFTSSLLTLRKMGEHSRQRAAFWVSRPAVARFVQAVMSPHD